MTLELRTVATRVPEPARHKEDANRDGPTGIYVRALHDRGEHQVGAGLREQWISADIAWLDRPSLLAWLHSRGGCNKEAEGVVLILFGWGHGEDDDVHPEAA